MGSQFLFQYVRIYYRILETNHNKLNPASKCLLRKPLIESSFPPKNHLNRQLCFAFNSLFNTVRED